MKWLKENECPWDEWTFGYAALNGNLENMKWLKENECPWDKYTVMVVSGMDGLFLVQHIMGI